MTDLENRAESLVELALAEDLDQAGDVTTDSFVPVDHRSIGKVHAREECVVAGIEIACAAFLKVDPSLSVSEKVPDGTRMKKGELALSVAGSTRGILTAERTALNFLQRLSGIATLTRRFVDRVEGTGVKILDTRKTTPGWRFLEKSAVAAGGGTNHRMGLYDAVMVKDNHLVAENTIEKLEAGIRSARETHPGIKIELEVDTLDQLRAFLKLEAPVDVILLDNMDNEMLKKAVEIRNEANLAVLLEASGGVNFETVRGIAETGIDYISIGALTHSATAVDLGLDLEADSRS
ncbi:MAG: carboxylating nicotinate-nucleotide diphosphorylase [Verrucomicrobiales bacterium]|nr:carboxylating nicotinate-nucleotide diphosphorylase [Verrucomicrobiales bacterium]